MSKHTPGPWHVANGVQIRSSRDQIAKVWMMRDGEGNANTRLIAAAPELLQALETIINSGTWYISALEIDFGKCDGEALEAMARAVIAEAKGETP